MPLRWEISHTDRTISIVGEGVVGLKDVEAYLDAVVTADAISYGKLFDTSGVVPEHDDHDLMMLAARIRAYYSTLKGGPLAFVATDPTTRQLIERFINLAASKRPVAIFKKAVKARAWLDAQLAR